MLPIRYLLRRTPHNNNLAAICSANSVPVRNSGFYNSPYLEDLGEPKTKFEVTKNPEEWKYVERLLAPAIVPEPIKKAEYPSGWKPQAQVMTDRPYFVARTKNHMIPVYLIVKQFGIKRLTYIKKIKGDIWQLHKEILQFLQEQQVKPIRSQVNEFAGYICINGDYVNAVKYWLEQKNF